MDSSHLIGGSEHREIALVDYDARWAALYLVEQSRIAEALGTRAVRIEHVGSTAVPGLSAKPIIDVQVSVPDVEAENDYLPALLSSGYVLRVREPGHRMVRTPALDVHVHICSAGSDWERRHLLFRDWLRHDSSDREEYGSLKLKLADRDWADMNAYADAKGPFIGKATERAEAWAQDFGWQISDPLATQNQP